MKIDVDVSELVKLAADLQADAALASGAVERQVAASTEQLYNQAVASAPVDTGELRSSIRRDVAGLARRVWSPVRQGFFQEYGTSVMPPQPWLMVFADQAHADLERRINRAKWGLST